MNLNEPLTSLKGIGEKTQKLFEQLGVSTVGGLLLYFPRDYERYPKITDVDDLIENKKNALCVRVNRPPTVNLRSQLKTAVLEVSGMEKRVRLMWFRAPYIRSLVKSGGTYVFYGRVTKKEELLYMDQPEIFGLDQYETLQKTLQPVYALTRGVTNHLIQKTVRLILDNCESAMEYLPEELRQRRHLSAYRFALENIHFPQDEESCIIARNRFVFDEFFFFILSMRLIREHSERISNEFVFSDAPFDAADLQDDSFVGSLIRSLPYTLTGAQLRTVRKVQEELRSGCVMQRLIQGDVGSGKTIIAFLAMLDAAHSGYQAALMAPTEVLARQHYQKLTALCSQLHLAYPVVLLTGSMTAKEKQAACDCIAREKAALVIGTHALIQEHVQYRGLALVITDEQHRFGVRQRETFSEKGCVPHILVMSATPIPRTLAIILYGDLDISVMDEVPAKRLPIKNCVVGTGSRPSAYRFMEKEIHAGHQVYVICPLVEASELSEGENVLDYTERLRGIFPPEIRISPLHGKMKAEEKNRTMEEFLAGDIQILVSTTVIEVGVDVPNATVMMIENAERFGLAQLHQLRGRVGRGDAQSYCILINGNEKNPKNKRLEILNRSNNGFEIASEDLRLRGPGDFFGIRQSGEFSFALADIYQDADVLSDASEEVEALLARDPGITGAEYRALRERLRLYAGNEFARFNL